VGDGKHLLKGYQPASLEPRSLFSLENKEAIAAGPSSIRRPAWDLGFREMGARREIIMARAKREADFSA